MKQWDDSAKTNRIWKSGLRGVNNLIKDGGSASEK